ncbi:unnamed protein product [Brassica rapa]|uniref:RRM domain-containing protein n=1 Tax=Brassica campestris TaxID=3711 RepID=A0A8D9GZH2_BRACM|nr:unnamed protein product [Brassica rapa]
MAMLLHLLHFQDSLDPCEKQMFQVFRYKTLEKKVKSADDAIQSLNGTVIGKNIVRLSWGRTPNKQWRGDSGQQWNGGYSRGYANHHNSNTSYNTSISFCLYLFFLQYLQVPSSPERVKDGRMLLHLLSFPNI